MKFHPIVSVILGFVVFFIFGVIDILLRNVGPFHFLIMFGFLFGGFVTIYFTKETNLKYAIYLAILIIMYFILVHIYRGLVFDLSLIFTILWVLLFTILGGYFGKRGADGHLRSFHPLVALIIGFIVTIVLSALFVDISDYLLPTVPDSTFSLIMTVALMGMLVIGGFVTTYISREKKLRYGTYLGILAILFVLIWNYLAFGQLSPSTYNPLIKILITAGYILAPTSGGFIGIKIEKQKGNQPIKQENHKNLYR